MPHTPGPWTVESETVGYDDSLRVVRWLIGDDNRSGRGYKPIATVHAGFTNTEADARLIARAPDLAAEVERLRAAVAAMIREFGTWADTAESLGGCHRSRADAYRACASRAVGVAAAEPRPAGDATAADNAKGG